MSTFPLSPVVDIREIDLTTVIPNVPSSIGAVAGSFQWGPVLEMRTISSETELVDTFYKPNNDTANTFFTAANFLSYAGSLRVVRNVTSSARNAVSSGTAVAIKNEDHYLANYGGGEGTVGTWAAKYPGVLGNSLKVSLCDSASWQTTLAETVLGTEAIGQTVLTMSASVAGKVVVGDYLSFGAATTKYQVTTVNTADVTVTPPLTAEVAAGASVTRYWEYQDLFDSAPGTSTYASEHSSTLDEVHVIVLDEDGSFTGVAGTVLERYQFLSKASDARTQNAQTNFYKTVINNQSRYIWWMDHPTGGTDWGQTALAAGTFATLTVPESVSLTGGVDGNALTSAEEIAAYDMFKDSETVDINLVMAGASTSATITDLISNLAEVRKDCVLFISPELADVQDNLGQEVTDTVAFRNTFNSSTYVVLDSGWKKQYDKYSDMFRYIPYNGDMAGLCARTDALIGPWASPAGFNRGFVKNVIKNVFNPDKADRDDLYKVGINSVVTFPGEGTILYGDKTMVSKPSAFDRINVRRLFILLEKAIATAAKYSLFELNDAFTRQQFVGAVEPFLRQIKGQRGIYDFRVVCDETNNTPQVIDTNSFVADIYIKPARSINFIRLNFVAVGTGVEFNEIVGEF